MSPLPNTTFRSELPPVVRKEFDQSHADAAGYLITEHDEDGHHTHVTAQSLQVRGPVGIVGSLVVNGTPITGSTAGVAPHHASHEPGGSDALAALSAAILTSGTLPDARLSANVQMKPIVNADLPANVARKDLDNLFSTTQSITGSLLMTGGVIERARSVPLGEWQDEPFSASKFQGSGSMNWVVAAGNINTNRYTLIGKTLIWELWLDNSSLTGTASNFVTMTIPGGFTTKAFGSGTISNVDNPGSITKDMQTYWFPAATTVRLIINTGNLTIGTFNLRVKLVIEIQ